MNAPVSAAALLAEVQSRFEATPDARLRQILQALVRHLHEFTAEVKATAPGAATE